MSIWPQAGLPLFGRGDVLELRPVETNEFWAIGDTEVVYLPHDHNKN